MRPEYYVVPRFERDCLLDPTFNPMQLETFV